jgi:hypothetical protein
LEFGFIPASKNNFTASVLPLALHKQEKFVFTIGDLHLRQGVASPPAASWHRQGNTSNENNTKLKLTNGLNFFIIGAPFIVMVSPCSIIYDDLKGKKV